LTKKATKIGAIAACHVPQRLGSWLGMRVFVEIGTDFSEGPRLTSVAKKSNTSEYTDIAFYFC